MVLLHTADLHIGKSLGGFSLLTDQERALEQIYDYIISEHADVLIIAGDIYDKQAPSAEAVALFDRYLTLFASKAAVMLVTGNHDSPERLAFASSLISKSGVHIAAVPTLVTYGGVDFFLLPFVKPSMLRQEHPEVETHAEAVSIMLSGLNGSAKRRVLAAHQFFISSNVEPERSESENIGGLESVDVSLLSDYRFDYAAFGHLHGPQTVGSPFMRYAGSPVKYSFSEYRHNKSIIKIELNEEKAETTALPLRPLRDMRKIRGPLRELLGDEVVNAADCNDFLHVTLTDTQLVPDAIGLLRERYPNVVQLVYENQRVCPEDAAADMSESKTALELFREFYALQNGAELPAVQEGLVAALLEDML